VNRPPISISKIAQLLKGQDKIVVSVATVTDDNRLLDVPKMTIAALRFTESARARIVKAGGKCMTLDQLVMTTPTGKFSFFLFFLNYNIAFN
jgi:large subunit ribosomal protein L18e